MWTVEPERKRDRSALVAVGIVGLVLLLAVLFAAFVFSHPLAGFVAPRAVAQVPITLSGSGTMQSATFRLDGGDYKADWTATPSSDGGCFHSLVLKGASGQSFGDIVSVDFSDGAQHTGTSLVHAVPAGDYYVQAFSGCSWHLVLVSR
jgi:hypothetical protein